jgi:hypothetical protein
MLSRRPCRFLEAQGLPSWLALLFVFEFFLLGIGIVFSDALARLGLLLLAATGALYVGWLLLGDFLQERSKLTIWILRVIVLAAIVVLVALVVLGVLKAGELTSCGAAGADGGDASGPLLSAARRLGESRLPTGPWTAQRRRSAAGVGSRLRSAIQACVAAAQTCASSVFTTNVREFT